MFYLIGKKGVGSSTRMKVMSSWWYENSIKGLSKYLSEDGKFIVCEDENYIYLKSC